MCSEDSEIRNMLESAGMEVAPNPAQILRVRERMMTVGRGYSARRRTRRTIAVAGALLTAAAAAGVAGTEAGRSFVRRIFTPVEPMAVITGEGPDGQSWMVSRSVHRVTVPANGEPRPADGRAAEPDAPGVQPFSPEEEKDMRDRMREIYEIQKAGGGRLVGLMEGPGIEVGQTIYTCYSVEYTLKNGQTTSVGQGLMGKQAANLRIDEIMKLRDAGAGQIISQRPFPIGLGRYTIRFTLSDGSTIDVETQYPPGPRQEREAIMAETRKLKKELRFTVDGPSSGPDGQVWGTLRYKLADGRVVGITEQVPPEAVTPDGKHVAVPETEPAEGAPNEGGRR